jgi:hypothetical protein
MGTLLSRPSGRECVLRLLDEQVYLVFFHSVDGGDENAWARVVKSRSQ